MNKMQVRVGTAFVSAVAAAAASVVLIGPAGADVQATSSAVYSCTEPPFPAGDSTWNLTITAPKYANLFDPIPLAVVLEPARPTPVEIPANGVKGTVAIRVTGPESRVVTATGLTNPTAVPVGELAVLTGGKATVIPEKTGVYKFTPASFELRTWMDTVLACVPKDEPSVAAQTKVIGTTPTVPPTP
ncbi:hypothetical protein [Umezawaea sp.]|uniref:hypothetical protein n=1 Tax=Umezawaea sp. TaxID=1955258 RepID=UPI002ED34127